MPSLIDRLPDRPAVTTSASPLRLSFADAIALLKPRVMSLVVFTGAIGLFIAPGHLAPWRAIAAIACIALGAGAAGAVNMWFDADIDAVMQRTKARPIPAGRVHPTTALVYGSLLSALAVLAMGLVANWMAAAWLAGSIGFYVLIYTMWLKRSTPQNIVIGGAAGAFPPIIGWAAATGQVGLLPVLLFAITFFWTPPHFWALSLYACQDYARARVPMLPVTHGARSTRRHILAYTLLLLPVSLVPSLAGVAGPVFGIGALALGLGFIALAWRVLNDAQDADGVSLTGDRPARLTFRYSLLYLSAIFALIAIDRWVG